jgi:hypothetical protein
MDSAAIQEVSMTDDPIASAIERIAQHETQAAFHASEALRWKIFVNGADELAGREPRYSDMALPASPTAATFSPIKPSIKTWDAGDFFGKPLATAAKAVLQARYEAAGKPAPASVEEIREALLQGTYDFGTTNAEQQRQSIRISLGKNSTTFVKLPNTDLFGLPEWYGQRPRVPRFRLNRNGSSEVPAPDPIETGGEEEAADPPAA